MKIIIVMALLSFLIVGCSSEERAFKECKFELVKVTAIKGGNLDKDTDWNRVMSRAFYQECMESKGYSLSSERFNKIK